MTHATRPMTDERLDRLIRDVLAERAEDIAAATASADAMAERITTRLRPSRVGRGWVLLAAALLAALLIAGALAVGSWLLDPFDELNLEPPADVPGFILSSYEGALTMSRALRDIQPMLTSGAAVASVLHAHLGDAPRAG